MALALPVAIRSAHEPVMPIASSTRASARWSVSARSSSGRPSCRPRRPSATTPPEPIRTETRLNTSSSGVAASSTSARSPRPKSPIRAPSSTTRPTARGCTAVPEIDTSAWALPRAWGKSGRKSRMAVKGRLACTLAS